MNKKESARKSFELLCESGQRIIDNSDEVKELKEINAHLVSELRARIQPQDGLKAFIGALSHCMTVSQMKKYGYGYLINLMMKD